jgi:hypothetical protein
MKDTRAITQVFDRFQRERVAFAGSVGDLARHDANVEALREAGAAALLHNLLSDPVVGVRCTAAGALGRLATASASVATSLVADGAMAPLVKMLGAPRSDDAAKRREHAAQRRAAATCLRGVAKHSAGDARAVAEAGALRAAAACLESPDAETKEAAAWLVDCVAAHAADLAEAAVAAGALGPLVACLDCSEVAAKRTAAAALGSVAQHGEGLARAVAAAGAVPALAAALAGGAQADVRLARNVLCTLGQVAQGGGDLAGAMVAGGALPDVARCLGAGDELVQRYAAAALRDVARHGEELAGAVAATPGCLQALVACTAQGKGLNQCVAGGSHEGAVREARRRAPAHAVPYIYASKAHSFDRASLGYAHTSETLQAALEGRLSCASLPPPTNSAFLPGSLCPCRLPGIMALGYLCSFTAPLAEAVIACGGLAALTAAVANGGAEPVQCAAAWALGQAGRHCAAHSQAVAESGALLALAGLEVAPQSSADLASKCGRAAAAVVAQLAALPALDALLRM